MGELLQAVSPYHCPSVELLLSLQMGPIRPPHHVQAQLAQCQQSHPLAFHGQPLLTPEMPPLSEQTHPTENRNIHAQGCTLAWNRQSGKAACRKQQQP